MEPEGGCLNTGWLNMFEEGVESPSGGHLSELDPLEDCLKLGSVLLRKC